MKHYLNDLRTLGLGLAVIWLSPISFTWAASPQSPPAQGNGSGGEAQVSIPQSIFIVPSNPKEGRNPFFPQTTPVVTQSKPRETVVDTTGLMLNGITSPPKRTAMINGRTFEPGEEAEVRTPGGAKVLIKCEDIKADSAVILVGGQRRELHLRAGF